MTDKTATVNSGPPLKEATLRSKVLGWLGYAAVMAAILFFFAPESWWQFGVAPVSERKVSSILRAPVLDGGEWDIAEHRGKVVVVNYWATWCAPCRFETPGLVRFAEGYKDRGVEIVGISMDDDRSAIAPFISSYGIKYPTLLPGVDTNLPPDGMPLPTTFLYDKEGRLSKKYTGIVLESTLSSDVDALLAE
ncbi:MAG: TlpA family protein disulfide reductase [Pyrinomonadaceae bacterium]|nr:TlpA family protein disulfide reductase [Pyrinomonadaceae bacterium]MBP6213149.1 TlpA family protein disulfide reductase [Pyrinomonadaceae bacterium]